VTKDVYRGPVKRTKQGAIQNMSAGDMKKLKEFWKGGSTSGTLVAAVDTFTGHKYATNTVLKFCRARFGNRGKKK